MYSTFKLPIQTKLFSFHKLSSYTIDYCLKIMLDSKINYKFNKLNKMYKQKLNLLKK